MELHHHLDLKVDDTAGLIALGIIALALLIAWLGTVALTRGSRQEGGGKFALDIRARHGLDEAQQHGVDRPGRALDVPRRGRP